MLLFRHGEGCLEVLDQSLLLLALSVAADHVKDRVEDLNVKLFQLENGRKDYLRGITFLGYPNNACNISYSFSSTLPD